MTVLIIGVRRKCYQAAIKLGLNVILWSDGPLHESRKKKLKDWIELPYSSCTNELSPEAKLALKKHSIDRVIANTEETVVLGSRVRRFLGLKSLAENVVERFHNKFVMKNSVQEIGIPITKYQLIDSNTSAEELINTLQLPVVVKPVDDSGAQDIKITKTLEELQLHMKPGLLAEAFVDGSEISVETFVKNGEILFHNVTEYLHQWKKSVIPAQLEPELQKLVLDTNDKILQHLGVDRGVTHAEFYLTKNGPVFGEVAIRPPGGYYMELIQKVYGFDPWKTYVQLSCGQEIGSLNPVPHGYAAVVMFHPGAGKITRISGESLLREKLSKIIDFKIRRKVGEQIQAHENTSNEIGHILFWAETREKLIEEIQFIEDHFKIELEE